VGRVIRSEVRSVPARRKFFLRGETHDAVAHDVAPIVTTNRCSRLNQIWSVVSVAAAAKQCASLLGRPATIRIALRDSNRVDLRQTCRLAVDITWRNRRGHQGRIGGCGERCDHHHGVQCRSVEWKRCGSACPSLGHIALARTPSGQSGRVLAGSDPAQCEPLEQSSAALRRLVKTAVASRMER